MFKFITHRPLWLNLLVGALLAVGIFSVFVLSLNWITHHNSSHTVPYVVGKTYAEAEKILEKAGFDVEIQDSIYTDTTRPSQVLKQFPDGDEVIKINRTIYLTINRSVPPMVEMPNLIGYSYRTAEMQLKSIGLYIGDTSYVPDLARNAVRRQLYAGQAIAPGTKIRMGSKIDFVLGSGVGDEEFVVPNLVGLTVRQAIALLEGNGLLVGTTLAMPGSEDVTDTLNAFIGRQLPAVRGDDQRLQRIRTGQSIDLWFQSQKPSNDSISVHSSDDQQP